MTSSRPGESLGVDGLSQVLHRCATTMLDGSVQEVLDALVSEVAAALSIDGAGAVLVSTAVAPEYVAASDVRAMELERLQSTLGQGPCVVAFASAEPVAVPDLDLDDRFPAFTAAAQDLGLSGVFTFPLRSGAASLGALDLYCMSTGMLGGHELRAAQVLADVVTAYVLNAQARADLAAVVDREQDAVRQLQALGDERDEFVSTVIHELGNPLVSIVGFTELLEDEPAGLSERQRGYVAAIRRNGDRLRVLAQDLLALFRLDMDGASVHTEVDLRDVVKVATDRLATEAGSATPVACTVPALPVVVRGCREDLERMLSNLVGNAVKYTPVGGTVMCTLTRDGGLATLEVRDTGIGIPEDEQGGLFTRFFRAPSARTSGIQGTGLGLAIVGAIVAGHGGTVVLTSASGSGTRVVVRLPVATPDRA